jgi:hypothetical protein
MYVPTLVCTVAMSALVLMLDAHKDFAYFVGAFIVRPMYHAMVSNLVV